MKRTKDLKLEEEKVENEATCFSGEEDNMDMDNHETPESSEKHSTLEN